jgi:hypothetical protein
MKRHPGKSELFDHAESIVAHRPISAKIGGHIAGCRACQAEVEGMRASIEFAVEAPELEPSTDFTSQLLLAAQQERRALNTRRSKMSVAASIAKIGGYAAAILLVGAICFSVALTGKPGGAAVQAIETTPPLDAATASRDAMAKTATDIETLASAVEQPSRKKPSLWELEHRRTVSALNANIEAARAALERNPGCDRANKIINVNMQRQAQALKALYVEKAM